MQSKRTTQKKYKAIEIADRDEEEPADAQILSQVSLDQAVEIETQIERQRLTEKESQKRQLAKILHEQQQSAINKKTCTGKERLDILLKQTEFFTTFLIQQRNLGLNASKDPELRTIQKSIFSNNKNLDPRQATAAKRKKKSTRFGAENDSGEDKEERLPMTRLEVQPSCLQGGQLRDYQLTSLNWLIGLYETGINGILADEMGLGKTIQAISLIGFLREFKEIKGYFLIIVPKTVIPNWKNEFKKWLPQCRVLNLIATKDEREEILKNQLQPGKFDVCLTTFEGVRLAMGPLLKFRWEYLIVDEAHKLKNEESQISQRLRQLDSRNRLLLTGTPLQNNLHELWSLLNFLLPEIFTSSSDFDEWFDLGSNEELNEQEKEVRNKQVIEQLHRILRPFLLRRIKREVEKQLKPKVEIHVSVGITELQKSIYRSLLKDSKLEKGNSVTYYKNILIQLRKVCNHPYLFENQEPEGAPELGEHIIKASGKMLFLDALCKKAKQDNNQVLIFSGFTSMLDILEDFCNFRQLLYCRLDGNTSLEDREQQIEEFVKPESTMNVFLISTRAGGLGLNLMSANIVVLYDSDWNPQCDLQAMDRAHRIGQTKVVQVFRLVTPNTMEEKMIERQTLKLKLDNMIIQKGRMAPKNQGLQKEEMQDMVNYGADAIFQVGDNLNDKDIDTLIREGEAKANALQQKATKLSKEKMDLTNFEMNSMNLYNFEDVDYARQRREEENLRMNELVRQMITEDNTTRIGRRVKNTKNLSEASLCPKIFQGRNVGISEERKKKKLNQVQDFRFFPQPDRLKELIEREIDAEYSGYFQGMEPVDFTEEEKIEKETLLSHGFLNWDRRDFQKFLQALEIYPREDYQQISDHVGTKTAEQIIAYQTVFFNQVSTLNESEKIKKMLEKSKSLHNFKKTAPLLIKTKVTALERPLDEMVINPIQKSKYFSREADILLLCLTHEIGYGKWSQIKHAIKRDNRVRFDHLLMSRTEVELQRRVDILVKTIEKEIENESKAPRDNKRVSRDEEFNDVEMAYQEFGSDNEEMKQESNKNEDDDIDDDDDYDDDVRVGMGGATHSPTNSRGQDVVVNDASDLIDDGEEVDFGQLENAAKQGLKKTKFN